MTQFIVDPETNQITGYKTKGGADTVFPFKSNKEFSVEYLATNAPRNTFDYLIIPDIIISSAVYRPIKFVINTMSLNDVNQWGVGYSSGMLYGVNLTKPTAISNVPQTSPAVGTQYSVNPPNSQFLTFYFTGFGSTNSGFFKCTVTYAISDN